MVVGTPRFRFLAPCALAALTAVLSLPAAAKGLPHSTTIARARDYALKQGLPLREVEAGPSFARVTRAVLPIRNNDDWQNIIETFGLRKNPSTGKYEGALILRDFQGDMTVVVPEGLGHGFVGRVLDPSASIRQFGPANYSWAESSGGNGVIVHLSPEQADHVGRWFEARKEDSFLQAPSGNSCSDIMMNIEVEPGPDGTHTVRKIPIEEALQRHPARETAGRESIPGSGVPMGLTLSRHTGVRASKQGVFMLMKWTRSGNGNVQILLVSEEPRRQAVFHAIGTALGSGRVAVRPTKTYEVTRQILAELTDEQVLGPIHPHGVDDGAIRPVPTAVSKPDAVSIND